MHCLVVIVPSCCQGVNLEDMGVGHYGLGVRWTGRAMDWACDGLVDWVCSTWGRTSCGLGMRGLGVLDVVRGVVLDTVQVDNGHGGQWL